MKKFNFTPQSATEEQLEINGHIFTLKNLDPVRLARDTLPGLLKAVETLGSVSTDTDNLNPEAVTAALGAWNEIDGILLYVHEKLKACIVDGITGRDFMEVLFPSGLSTNDAINFYASLISQLADGGNE